MLEPGACFRTGDPPKPFYGGPIGPDRLLSKDDAQVAGLGLRLDPGQDAFALAVAYRMARRYAYRRECRLLMRLRVENSSSL